MNGTPVISFSGLTLSYGKKLALDHVTLDLPARKLIGLIGPDGVGKSTLLSLITGAHAMQKGRLEVLGGDMRSKEHRDKVCPKIAYMPQGLGKNLYFTLSVEENLQFFGKLFGHNADERRRRIDHLTRSTGLYNFLDRPAGKLSGGMKQKLGLCCALIHDPDLLVLDEPTAALDPIAENDIYLKYSEMTVGKSSVFISHRLSTTRHADKIYMFDNGCLIESGTHEELMESDGKYAYMFRLQAQKYTEQKEADNGETDCCDL